MRASKRQLIWLFAVFFLMVTTASAAWAEGESEEVMETPLDLDELVRPSVVYAEITVETPPTMIGQLGAVRLANSALEK